ncbi:hypothetical protein SNEBB_004963 [Seison nebaliae]|nr:hypothetical protein SNEBB_004963 [Seison nebaliae]
MHTDLSDNILHNEQCQKIIDDLKKCQEESFLKRSFGLCNDLKRRLDICLKRERMSRRDRNGIYGDATRRKVLALRPELSEKIEELDQLKLKAGEKKQPKQW